MLVVRVLPLVSTSLASSIAITRPVLPENSARVCHKRLTQLEILQALSDFHHIARLVIDDKKCGTLL